jgi:signal transduction histidine kinase
MEDLAAREEQVRRLAEHMLHVEEVERRRISRELHDEAGQSMLCIRLALEMMEQALPPEAEPIRARLVETRDITERTILEVRRLIAALSPAVLEQLGLGAALRQLVTRFRAVHPARVRLHLSRLQNLPKKIELIVYRLVQECCNNIAKHSGASHVNLSAASADGILRLLVEDNGVGFHTEEALQRRDSFGLAGIRERVALLGGKFELESWPAPEIVHKDAVNKDTVSHSVPGGKAGGKKSKLRITPKPRRGTRIRIELPVPREADLSPKRRVRSAGG